MTTLSRSLFVGTAIPVVLAFALAGCSSRESTASPPPSAMTPPPTPSPSPTPTPTPTPTSIYSVTSCLTQNWPGSAGTVASIVIPDTLTIDFNQPSGFPNGRFPNDPVVDMTLTAILLDMDAPGQNNRTLADVPLNPPSELRLNPTQTLRAEFPYFKDHEGNPELAGTNGVNFNFRTNAASQYTVVERMGMPAVATALVGSGQPKIDYNEGTPAMDSIGTFRAELISNLEHITDGLYDDLVALGLTPCAQPR